MAAGLALAANGAPFCGANGSHWMVVFHGLGSPPTFRTTGHTLKCELQHAIARHLHGLLSRPGGEWHASLGTDCPGGRWHAIAARSITYITPQGAEHATNWCPTAGEAPVPLTDPRHVPTRREADSWPLAQLGMIRRRGSHKQTRGRLATLKDNERKSAIGKSEVDMRVKGKANERGSRVEGER